MGSRVDASSQHRSGSAWLSWLREIVIVVVGALLASTILRLFVVQMFVIPSESMENTLIPRDRVAVQKILGFERGDVVVFRDANQWLTPTEVDHSPLQKALIFVGLAPDDATNHLIKRVIGMPGDHVRCCDASGRITVNGVALDERDYLYRDQATQRQVEPSQVPFDVVVPRGRIFVLGDHRNDSKDSRCHLFDPGTGEPQGDSGFIPVDAVVGSAVAIVYPFSRIQGLARPRIFEQVPQGDDPPSHAVINGPEIVC